MTLVERLTQEINNKKTRSAWRRGVKEYALELLENLEEATNYQKREPNNSTELKAMLLNGAKDWAEFSWGGCSLIYDCDIAERLSNPTELKRTHGGEKQPNSREQWLDVQARALKQAAFWIAGAYHAIKKEEKNI